MYIPPVQNLQKRGIDEDVACSFTEDILDYIPHNSNSVVCGEFNARIGEMSPTIEEVQIPRKSEDKWSNARAPWVL